MFGVVPKTLWQKRIQANADNQIRLGLNTAVVRTGKHDGRHRDGHRQQADREDAGHPPESGAAAAVSHGGGSAARRRRHRHQHPPALRPLRLEHHAARGRLGDADIPERALLRACGRGGACASATRPRPRQLHLTELRSADRHRPDDTAGRRGIRAGGEICRRGFPSNSSPGIRPTCSACTSRHHAQPIAPLIRGDAARLLHRRPASQPRTIWTPPGAWATTSTRCE